MIADPFGARAIREQVLATWVASPARFREDANAEEDLALNGYRDRLVVELAQNAADAAARAGVPGNLLLRFARDGDQAVLVAANTGAPLDAEGVQGLATLRASSKRDDADPADRDGPGQRPAAPPGRSGLPVGRFGVGFAAVLTVCDEPVIMSRTGAVRFSAADTRTLVEEVSAQAPELRAELARRDGHVPVLRLPFETEGSPPTGYDTAVVLPLRDAAAEEVVLRRLGEIGDDLLLALPALACVTIEVPGRSALVLTDAESRWQVWRAVGRHEPEALADRPTEERRRPSWQVTWALPRSEDRAAGRQPAGAGVVHAPTPTDEPLDWPALLIGSFPLDSTRRQVATGPATDTLVGAAASLYVEALCDLAESGREVLSFVPIGFPTGVLDGALRARVLELLPGAPILRVVGDREPMLVKPRSAVAVEPPVGAEEEVLEALAPSIAGLVPARRAEERVLRRLGVQFVPPAEVIEALPDHADPARWQALYAALIPLSADPLVREALSGLPVPLADGRTARGARGLLLPVGNVTRPLDLLGADHTEAFGLLGLRAVHPRAAHELLARLGAVAAGPRAVLEQPSVRAAVANSPDADDPAELADAVLTLVAAAAGAGELAPGDLPWLGDLALPDSEGELAPASALALPGSTADRLLDPDEIGLVAQELVARWGGPALAAAGVLDEPAVLRVADLAPAAALGDEPSGRGGYAGVGGGPGARHDPSNDAGVDQATDLDGFEDWWDDVSDQLERAGLDPADAVIPEFLAVRDLDAVRPSARAELVARLVAEPSARQAVVGPTRVVTGSGRLDVGAYTAWWLGRAIADQGGAGDSGRDGAPRFADPDAEPLVRRLLPPAPSTLSGLDDAVRAALGAVRTVGELDAAAVPAVLARTVSSEFSVLAEPAEPARLSVGDLVAVYRRLAQLAGQAADLSLLLREPPRLVRVPDPEASGGTRVVEAVEAVVASSPMHLQRHDLGRFVVAGEAADALAALLDLRLADEEIAGVVDEAAGAGHLAGLADEVAALLGRQELSWCEHETLVVDGVEVDWWVDDAGLVHASTVDGLARGLAWGCGRWSARHAVAAVLEDPAGAGDVLVDEAFGS